MLSHAAPAAAAASMLAPSHQLQAGFDGEAKCKAQQRNLTPKLKQVGPILPRPNPASLRATTPIHAAPPISPSVSWLAVASANAT